MLSDIVFISYWEVDAEENFRNLLIRFPYAKRIRGIRGIREAHIQAAKLAKTDWFYVVDGDARILPEFDFSFAPSAGHEKISFIWTAVNPVNDLVYGYGGVKLFNRKAVLDSIEPNGPDFSISVTKYVTIMIGEPPACITAFNTDEFSSWRAAFRECSKLASSVIPGEVPTETEERLSAWCEIGSDRPFGEFVLDGARRGRDYGTKNAADGNALKRINDYDWMKRIFHGLESE